MTIVSLLKDIPSVVWSGISASVITLSGVMFSDWRNTKRLTLQHKFAESEAEKARMLALRREVYLPVAATVTEMQSLLFSLATTEPEADEETAATKFGKAVAQLALVAPTETAILVQELASEFAFAHIALMKEAVRASDERSTAELSSSYRKLAQADYDRVSLEINKFLEAGKSDELAFNALQRSREAFRAQLQEHWTNEVEALARLSKEVNDYLRIAARTLEPITQLSIKVLVHLRHDLGQDTDIEAFARAMERSHVRVVQSLNDLIDDIDQRRDEEAKSELASRENQA